MKLFGNPILIYLLDDGRLLLRTSGTEPLVRVMVEAETEEEREEYLEQLRENFISEISYECVEIDPEEAGQYEIIYDERD